MSVFHITYNSDSNSEIMHSMKTYKPTQQKNGLLTLTHQHIVIMKANKEVYSYLLRHNVNTTTL